MLAGQKWSKSLPTWVRDEADNRKAKAPLTLCCLRHPCSCHDICLTKWWVTRWFCILFSYASGRPILLHLSITISRLSSIISARTISPSFVAVANSQSHNSCVYHVGHVVHLVIHSHCIGFDGWGAYYAPDRLTPCLLSTEPDNKGKTPWCFSRNLALV